jgi:8-hydroxy-5-deazaflavin:NADPH oxidoreductase
MTVGIIGAGSIGQALAVQSLRAGHDVIIANSRGPESLVDVVAIAVPWRAIPDAVADIDWNGRIVIDASNPVMAPDFKIADLGGRTSGEFVAGLMPGARVVKVANTLPAAVLASDPREAGGQRVLVLSGDDDGAKERVAALFNAAGFATVDLGGLVDGGRLQDVPGGVFPRLNLIQIA